MVNFGAKLSQMPFYVSAKRQFGSDEVFYDCLKSLIIKYLCNLRGHLCFQIYARQWLFAYSMMWEMFQIVESD